MNEDKFKDINEKLKKLEEIISNEGYIFKDNSLYVREMVDRYALIYNQTTGNDVLVIGKITDNKVDFQLFEKPLK